MPGSVLGDFTYCHLSCRPFRPCELEIIVLTFQWKKKIQVVGNLTLISKEHNVYNEGAPGSG